MQLCLVSCIFHLLGVWGTKGEIKGKEGERFGKGAKKKTGEGQLVEERGEEEETSEEKSLGGIRGEADQVQYSRYTQGKRAMREKRRGQEEDRNM